MSLLSTVKVGQRMKPLCALLYGVHGIGKSTWPSKAPKPIYVGSEENDELEVARFPKPSDWATLESQLRALRDEEHDYKTIVVDTIDSLEMLAEKEILQGNDANKTLATAMGGYGKGLEKQSSMFKHLRDDYLIPLREKKGMNVILLAHAQKDKFEDPITITQYDYYYPHLQKRVRPIFEDWVSCILFANYQLYKAESNHGKEYAIGEGERRVFTEERPSYIAKNRFGLPHEMGLDFDELWKCYKTFFDGAKKFEGDQQASIHEKIKSRMEKVNPQIRPRVEAAVKQAGDDEAELERIYDKMGSV